MNFKWLLILCYLALVACGGGDETFDEGEIRKRPSGKVSGTAFDGLIINGTITVYDFSSGEKGAILGTTTTDGSGLYEIFISTADKPIFLEVCGGRYVEEASGIPVLLRDNQCLYGLHNYVSGQPVKMALTYFSTMATGYAECQIGDNNSAIESIVEASNELASNLAGYNITEVQPLDVSLDENSTAFLTDPIKAGMYAAGISQMMLDISMKNNQSPHEIHNSIYFASLMYRDIKSDCLLDGFGELGNPLSMGAIPIHGDHYRYLQSRGILEFINSERNATSLTVDDFEDYVFRFNSINDSTTVVTPKTIDNGSEINSFYPSEKAILNGNTTISAQIVDSIGIVETRFLINNEELAIIPRSKSPSIEIDTSLYGSGDFNISIEVTNDLFIKTEASHLVTFSNDAPDINNFLPGNSSNVTGEITITSEIGSQLSLERVSYLIDGNTIINYNNPTAGIFTYIFDTSSLSDGDYQMVVVAENIAGQVSEKISMINVDNTIPSVTNFVPLDGEILSGASTIRADVSDSSGIKNVTFLIDGELLNGSGTQTNPSQTFDTGRFSDGLHTISIVVTDNFDLTTTVTRNVRIVNNPLALNVHSVKYFEAPKIQQPFICPEVSFTLTDTSDLGFDYFKYNEEVLAENTNISIMNISKPATSSCQDLIAKGRIGGVFNKKIKSSFHIVDHCALKYFETCVSNRYQCNYSVEESC